MISSSAVGGLREGFGPLTFVVTDQLIDRTWGRADTYFDGTTAEGVPRPGFSTCRPRTHFVRRCVHIWVPPWQRINFPASCKEQSWS
ncbi:S-methyl-5'-thioadenosine phosphorylase [Arthrobacter sp. Hiyo4]|nr:S-methyl-5'-thioadenosine phosphorylase [Arthrobacter sp. Hiyo4]